MQTLEAPSTRHILILWKDVWVAVKEARLRLQRLQVGQSLIVEYDAPQRRAVLRLAELHKAVVVPNGDMTNETQTPEGHWRLTLQRSGT